MPPSSMTKLMTLYLVYDQLKQGRLKLEDELPVTEKAWRMQGSKMFVQIGSTVKVEDLIRGVVVQSGNDAAIVLAEAIGGSEEQFAEKMNAKAKELGLTHSFFKNCTGWPDPEQHMSRARHRHPCRRPSSAISPTTIITIRRKHSSTTASSRATATRWCRRAPPTA